MYSGEYDEIMATALAIGICEEWERGREREVWGSEHLCVHK
jgi:hypothetical protein